MIWREHNNHFDDCYFFLVNIIRINRNNHSKWTYPILDSAKRPAQNDLTRDLNLSKEPFELLVSRLNDKTVLKQGTKMTFNRTREKGMPHLFIQKDNLELSQH